jgi:acyl dehydratase
MPACVHSDAALSVDKLRLPAGLSRQYARVSGDYNPIHLSSLSAKVFGFRSVVAHGMSVLGVALPTLLGTGV